MTYFPLLTIEQQNAVSNSVHLSYAKMVKHVHYNYGLSHWNPTIIVDCLGKLSTCGGFQYWNRIPYVIIGVHDILKPDKDGKFYMSEYKRFEKDPDIGGIASMNWKKVLAAYVAHEIAHALHWTPGTKPYLRRALNLPHQILRDDKAHGKMWKAIYKDLRINFVNHLMDHYPAFV